MQCPACDSFKANKHSGAYQMQCLHCCARLVAKTHPMRGAASAMMVAIKRSIARHASPFGPADVSECARRLLEKRP